MGKIRNRGPRMKDYLAAVEKLRKDAAQCVLIRDFATDRKKREVFDRFSISPCSRIKLKWLLPSEKAERNSKDGLPAARSTRLFALSSAAMTTEHPWV